MSELTPRRKRGWMNLRITQVIEETWDTKTFYFVDDEDNEVAFDYIAGQYLTLRYDGIEKKPIVRSYTMSSAPIENDRVALTVKRVEGGLISNWMCDQLKVGDIVKARGPIGRFCFDPGRCQSHLVMVGAGSGVTPFLSILKEYADKLGQEGCPDKLSLLVAYRSKKDLIAWSDIERLRTLPGINIHVTLTREDASAEGFGFGRPDPSMIDSFLSGNYTGASFMTCGPTQLMDMTVEHLKGKNVADADIQTEAFD